MLRYFSRIASPWGSTLSLRQKPPDLDQLDIEQESLVGVDGLGDGARSRTSNHLCNSNSTGNQSRSSSASSRTLVDPLDYDKFGRAALQLQVSPDHQSISITELYYQCQNLAHYPLAPVLARRYLQRFLSSCFNRDSAAALRDNPDSIFSLSSEFNDFETKEWLDSQYRKTADRFQSYLSRRKNAGPREMFKDRKDAERWCKQSAVVKYVDGSWLQSTFQSTSGLEVVVAGQTYSVKSARRASRVSWQVLSEELGDGDLHKEHCAVYERLMDSLQGEDTPRADDETFVDWNRNENGEIPNKQPYVAAMLQLAMSTSPNEFLPEILGFNLSYEGLPYHLLVTSQELKELKIDPYYFVLHISIDNAHSGHSAMARMAVSDFLSSAASTHGKHEANKLWKRVQAGFHLADYVRTTPETFKELEKKKTTLADPLFWNEDIPIFPEEDLAVLEHVKLADNNYEQQLLAVFRAKAHAAQGLHTTAPGKIGGKSIGEWLTTEGLEGRRGKAFMEALGSNRAWIVPGENCHQSRLIKQCEWGGKMFGAFTNREVGLLRAWAGSLPSEENLSKPVSSNNDAKTALIAPYLDFILGSGPRSGIEMEWRRYFDTAVQPLDLSDSLQHISSFSAWIQAAPAVYETLLRHPHGIRGLLKAHTNGFLTQLLPALGPTPPHFIAEILSRQIGSDDGIQQMTFLKRLLPVLFLSSALLEWMPAASPAKLASPLGMATIRTQRVLHGFSDAYEVEAVCAGTDDVTTVKAGIWDLATEMIPHGDIFTLRSFEDYEGEALALPALILLLNSQPTLHLPILLGVQLCLNVHLHAPLSRESWTPSDAWRRRLEEITSQSRPHIIHAIELGACEETSRAWEGLGDWNENVSLGFKIAKICLST